MVKIALLIGVSNYKEGLNPLPCAVRDVEAMHRVLQHQNMGGFNEVKTLSNPDPMEMQEAIETFFSDRAKDDLALLFFSGHGVKDDNGRLYFGTRSTRKNEKGSLVKATAVPANFVQDIMSNSRCKTQVVILDCCFSGAFAEGLTAKDDGAVDVQAQFGSEGRAVLTSSTSTQYSFEQEDSDLSIYTRYIVEGIETGAADADGDGVISIDELHDYALKKVQTTTPAMKPRIFPAGEGFRIQLARVYENDPKLIYRREVERCIVRGEVSVVGRKILSNLRDKYGLLPEQTITIENEVLKPSREYQKKLQRYEQAFAEAVQQEYPISAATRNDLQRYQEMLGLIHEDVMPIEAKCKPYQARFFPLTKLNSRKESTPSVLQRNQSEVVQAQEAHSENRQEQGVHRNISQSNRANRSIALASLIAASLVVTSLLLRFATQRPHSIQVEQAMQSEAKTYLSFLNKAQQNYFAARGNFATTIEELQLSISAETETYRYQILPHDVRTGIVVMTAQAKISNLRSYTGIVFVAGGTTLAGICETTAPSMTPPAIGQDLASADFQVPCPSGSHPLDN